MDTRQKVTAVLVSIVSTVAIRFSPKTGSLRGRLEAPGFRHGEESLPLKVGDALDGLEPANNLSE
jgi:hypothetical protein